MKQMHLLSGVLVILAIISFTSCKPSRVWATKDKDKSNQKEVYEERRNDHEERYEPRYEPAPPPRPRSYVSTPLILTPSAGFVMNRYPDGRFYHRSPQGFIYWKAYDNRFYLDRSYIHRVRYDRYEYEKWNDYYRNYNNQRRY